MHNIVFSTKSVGVFSSLAPISGIIELLHPSLIVLPYSLYRVPNQTPFNNTIAPRTILQVSFSNIVFTPASSILLTKIKFLSKPGMFRTPGSVLILPSMSLNLNFLHLMIMVVDSSHRKTLPPSYLSYSHNHSLWGVM